MKELVLTAIMKLSEVIVNKLFCFCVFSYMSSFHTVKGKLLDTTYVYYLSDLNRY